MFFRFPPDARWSPERNTVEFGIGVGEYEGVVLNVRCKFRAAPAARQSHPDVVPIRMARKRMSGKHISGESLSRRRFASDRIDHCVAATVSKPSCDQRYHQKRRHLHRRTQRGRNQSSRLLIGCQKKGNAQARRNAPSRSPARQSSRGRR